MTNLGTVSIINLSGSAGGDLSAGQIGLTDGVTKFRLIVRNQALETDMALTALGFAGVEDTDWITIR
jgi:hypothetical protein